VGPQEGAVRGVEEKGVVRGAVMAEELQAKQQASTSARTSCGIYEYILPVRRQRTQLLLVRHTTLPIVVQCKHLVVNIPVTSRLSVILRCA